MVNLTAARGESAAKRDKMFFGLAGIKKMIGFPKIDSDFALITDPETGEKEWEAKRLARRIDTIGIPDLMLDDNWDLKLLPNEIQESQNQLDKLPKGIKLLSVSPGTKMQSKDWTIENWVALLKLLAPVLKDWGLVIIGAPDEKDAAEQCANAWHEGKVLNICGKVSLRECAGVIKNTNLFLGHDSGPMHLAGALGVPVVAVFAAINIPRQWFPRGNNNRIIYHKTDCAGCKLTVCTEQNKKCILSITPLEVFNETMKTIDNLS
jgi:ADP-heptose:LPS heptosyltransferase